MYVIIVEVKLFIRNSFLRTKIQIKYLKILFPK